MKIEVIIQVRMGSERLPGKALMKINGISLLQSLINQLNFSKLVDRKIIATTSNVEDNVIEEFAQSQKIDFFRGNDTDVLDRYYQCAKNFSVKHIVRISGDAPLIDPEIVDDAIKLYRDGNFDYVNNLDRKSFPVGTEVEIFSFKTLENVWKNASKPSEREHVTSHIYNNPDKFSIGYLKNDKNLSPHLHWTVDRIEDLQFVQEIYKRIQKRPILLEDILSVINEDSFLLEINRNTSPEEGYLKSLQEDERAKSG